MKTAITFTWTSLLWLGLLPSGTAQIISSLPFTNAVKANDEMVLNVRNASGFTTKRTALSNIFSANGLTVYTNPWNSALSAGVIRGLGIGTNLGTAWGTNTTAPTTTNTLTIPLIGAASPYPWIIPVSGIVGEITHFTIALKGFAHPSPPDVGAVLVSPGGVAVELFDGCGGFTAVTNLVLTFDRTGGPMTNQPLVTGTYIPTVLATNVFASPCPAGPYLHSTTNFEDAAVDPNGLWKLYVQDFTELDAGSITQAVITIVAGQPHTDFIGSFYGNLSGGSNAASATLATYVSGTLTNNTSGNAATATLATYVSGTLTNNTSGNAATATLATYVSGTLTNTISGDLTNSLKSPSPTALVTIYKNSAGNARLSYNGSEETFYFQVAPRMDGSLITNIDGFYLKTATVNSNSFDGPTMGVIRNSHNLKYPTNANTIAFDVGNRYSQMVTNANMTFSSCANVDATLTNVNWGVCLITNSAGAGSPKTISVPANWQDIGNVGTIYNTNQGVLSVIVYPGAGTNFVWRGR